MNARLAVYGTIVALGAAVACGELIGASPSDQPPEGDGGAADVLPTQNCPSDCLPRAPDGWVGPNAVFDDEVALDAGLPACPGAYPQPEERAWRDLDASPASCSCGTGTVKGAVCTSLLEKADTDCANVASTTTLNIGSGMGSLCVAVNSLAYRVGAPVLTEAGVCAFDMQNTLINGDVSARGAAACGPATALPVCADRTDCLAPPAAGASFSRFCIHRAGDLACPSADYAVRFVAYRSITDDRACTPCVGTTSAVHCQTSYGVVASCPAIAAGSSRSATDCVNADVTNGAIIASDLKPIPAGCAQTGGGAPTGDAHGTDPVTFCCSR